MRSPSSGIIAWGSAAALMASGMLAICFAPKAYFARARAEISTLDVSPTGLASFTRVDFAYGNRMLPQEMVARMNSTGSLRRALKNLQWPDDEQAMEEAGDAVMAHLVPGSTVIEVMTRGNTPEKARALVEAVITAQNETRREERVRLADQLLAVLAAAADELAKESPGIADKLSKFDVHRPIEYSTYSTKIEDTLMGITTQRLKMAESLRRLEGLESKGTATLIQNLDDLTQKEVEEDYFASNVGYVTLRSSITAKQAEWARVQATQGLSSDASKQMISELQSLEASLKHYLEGAIVQLRSHIDALDQSAQNILQRLKAREDSLTAVRGAILSPEYTALILRSESIRSQLKQIDMRRTEILTYKQLNQPALTLVSPAEATEAPEDRYRSVRLVFAGFSALLIGLSISQILRHRAIPHQGHSLA